MTFHALHIFLLCYTVLFMVFTQTEVSHPAEVSGFNAFRKQWQNMPGLFCCNENGGKTWQNLNENIEIIINTGHVKKFAIVLGRNFFQIDVKMSFFSDFQKCIPCLQIHWFQQLPWTTTESGYQDVQDGIQNTVVTCLKGRTNIRTTASRKNPCGSVW